MRSGESKPDHDRPAGSEPSPGDAHRSGLDSVRPDHLQQLAEGRELSRAALTEALILEQAARAQAEASDNAKSRLLALVSHELRTPMGAVIAMADLLLGGHLEGRQRRYAETLQSSARGLLALLNEILDFSKLEAGHFELDSEPFDLSALLNDLSADLETRAESKSLAAEIDIAPGCPCWVRGDGVRLRQILTNLIDNAVKFTADGSVTLSVTAEDRDDSVWLSFSVRDTGIGMNGGDRSRVFQPYVQVDPKIAAEYGGTGLGLFIARKLAELMGGTLTCESQPGEGTCFRLDVPMRRAEAPQDEATETLGGEGPLEGTVLVVEDNAVNRMLIGAYLDEFGVGYKMAGSGAEALRLLDERTFDLVLMDIMMPEMDGIEATRRIRAMESEASRVPVIALTANAMKGDRETYLEAGMNAYLSKPIRGRELYDEIAAFLSPKAQSGGERASKR
ncbi:Autoinducer 2 sensor kinase/phosphatase LuxQ [Methyloligella halotolerans]|uniref:histidine kinase n=1 Tax=Methyloligella halotolerans TaxID=1177755 RepID=A0A1E2RV24_9HYPH|nr:ATP-binding protein [Methyloligella halotolerans]ODA66106.1 Autoinducer 2 sensor kinase/phosphatase LuxQ [Methyloligella halotolerans]